MYHGVSGNGMRGSLGAGAGQALEYCSDWGYENFEFIFAGRERKSSLRLSALPIG
jgi:hypothetical protein